MLKCAFYEREITPPLGSHLPGYANIRKANGVKDRLMAKACVFSNGDETVAMIAIDTLHMENELRNEIAKRIHRYTGIPKKNVLVAAVHTHTGIPGWNHICDDEEVNDSQAHYFDVFPKIIADCAILAYQRLQDTDMVFCVGNVEGISFCRNYIMKDQDPRTNPPRLSPDIIRPASPTDTELPVLFARAKDGTPLGAIVCFACHLDCVGGLEFSGDYASELSKQLKATYGQDFVTIFFIGTAGDINHFNINVADDAPDHYRMMGRKLADEVIKSVSIAKPIEGDLIKCNYEQIQIPRREISKASLDYARHIVATVKETPGEKIAADGTNRDMYELMMSRKILWFMETSPEIYDIVLQYIQIGDVSFFGFPSEIYCRFGIDIKTRANSSKCIVATCCNGTYGYVPTRDMLYESIYSSRAGSNRLHSDAGYIMVEKLLEMSKC